MRVLVIDDNPDFRQMLMTWLFKENHYARGADGGPETLDVLRRCEHDVITIELMLPKVNALTLPQIRATCPETPIVVISTAPNAPVAMPADQSGANACFDKPLDFEAFRSELDRLNSKRKLVFLL